MSGQSLKLCSIALLLFILTDMVWLGFIARNLYIHHYGPWLRLTAGQLKPLWWAALIVYLLLALSVSIFILPLANNSLYLAAAYGAIMGAIIYGVYDFTCIAIFKDFPVGMGCLDWLWGAVLCSWVSFITLYAHLHTQAN